MKNSCIFCGFKANGNAVSYRNGVGMVCQSDAACFRRLKIRIAKYTEIVMAGQALSNICFNLSQRSGRTLEAGDCESMRAAYIKWDKVSK